MWTYGNIRIFAQSEVDAGAQIIPRIQPLGGGTILQVFGHEDVIKTITAIIVGTDDADHMDTLVASGVAFPLVGPEGAMGNYYPKTIGVTRQLSAYQTIRQDLDCTAPVYLVNLELYGA